MYYRKARRFSWLRLIFWLLTLLSNVHALTPPATTATFSVPRTYSLRMTASDSLLTNIDELAVTVIDPTEQSSLSLTSDPGDPVGAGQSYFISPADRNFRGVSYAGHSVTIYAGNGGLDWELSFSAPAGQVLKVGTYNGAIRYGSAIAPVVNVSGNGREPGASTGSFEIKKIIYGEGNTLLSFWATFIQHAGGAMAALRGEIKYRAEATELSVNQSPGVSAGLDQQIVFPAPALLAGTAGDDDLPSAIALTTHWSQVSGPGSVTFGDAGAPGTTATFSAPGEYLLRLTASDSLLTVSDVVSVVVSDPNEHTFAVIDQEQNSSRNGGFDAHYNLGNTDFSLARNYANGITVGLFQGGRAWSLEFRAPNNQLLQAGSYPVATNFNSQALDEAGLEVNGYNFGFGKLSGSFEVKQIVYGAGQTILSFWATFIQHEGTGMPLIGEVRYKAISLAPDLVNTTASATTGQPFHYQIYSIDHEASNFSVSELPDGLLLNADTGVISGTPTTPGVYELIQSARNGFGSDSTTLRMTVTDPQSDYFEGRVELHGPKLQFQASNRKANGENGEPRHAGNIGDASLWWSWIAPSTGLYIFSAASAEFPAVVDVYQGETLGSLEAVLDESDQPGLVTFSAQAGQSYVFALDTANGSTGMAQLAIKPSTAQKIDLLKVETTAGGTVTAGFRGTSFRHLGRRYTVVARPVPGYLFAGWSGTLSQELPRLRFTMKKGLTLTATFVPNPFLETRGTYQGVLNNIGGDPSATIGHISLTLGRQAGFSAAIRFGARHYRLHGQFAPDGTFSGTFPQEHKSSLRVNVTIDAAGNLTGTINNGFITAGLYAQRSFYQRGRNPAPQTGRYTVVLVSGREEAVPLGDGFGRLVIGRSGNLRFSGMLPDGTPISLGSELTGEGNWPFYFGASGNRASASGLVVFEDLTGSDFHGTLTWSKAARAAVYPAGFTTSLTVIGSRYARPPRHALVLDLEADTDNATVDLSTTQNTISKLITITQQNEVLIDGSPFRMMIRDGLFRGHFLEAGSHQLVHFRGALLQKQTRGGGFFRIGPETGSIELRAPGAEPGLSTE